ncbi:hypothetical protein EMCRGX_G032510 [Ephydatia muelleri]
MPFDGQAFGQFVELLAHVGRCTDLLLLLRSSQLAIDIIDTTCRELAIIPVARAFFGLCHLKSGHCLSPFQKLSAQEVRQDYRLRVIVHLNQNSLILQRLSKGAYNYYYEQVKNDFLHDDIYPPVSVNTKIWMAGIDIARLAMLTKESFDVLVKRKTVLDTTLPPSLKKLWHSDKKTRDTVRQVFEKFSDVRLDSENHFKAKYLEVFEQDKMCGIHVFKATWSNGIHSHNGHDPILTLLSSEIGISRVVKGAEGESKQQKVCSIFELRKVEVKLPKSVTIAFERDPSETTTEAEEVFPSKWTLLFANSEHTICFATLLNAYYQIMVDANFSILEGDPSIIPSDEMLSKNDECKAELCHVAISPDSVEKVLEMYNKEDGTFLIRESRSSEDSYTLSLCHSQRIKNFRISRDTDGSLSLRDPAGMTAEQPMKSFSSMAALVEHHKAEKDGLPTHLKINCSPKEVAKTAGAIPLVILKHVAAHRDSSPSTSDGADSSAPATLDSPQLPSSTLGEGPNPDPSSQKPKHPKTDALVKGGVPWVPFEQLVLSKKLGSGHFSNVYAATWTNPGRQKLEVAVKVPNVDGEELDAVMNDLEREIRTMHSLDHKYIVKLIGISDAPHFLTSIGGRIPFVIMEFVSRGSLRSYLQELQERSHREPRTAQNSIKTLLLFSEQIANGMEYLENQKLVHRDLAARNVLIESDKLIKISDFGLSRVPTRSDYYYSNNLKELPIFWYAPECLKTRRFTSKGDVWSYGVTLWEMFTLGHFPNHVFQTQLRNLQPPTGQPAVNIHTQMVRLLTEGKSPSSPPPPPLPRVAPCSSDIYDIMVECWQVKPEDRPTFHDLQLKVALVATQL